MPLSFILFSLIVVPTEIFCLLHHPYYNPNLSIFKIYIPIIIFSENGIPVVFEI